MPVIEFFFFLIILSITAVILFYALVAYAVVGLIVLGAILLLGWLPILMCATDIHMNIGEGFIGTWALYSTWAYVLASIGLVGLMIIKPDPDGLPPAWKFLAIFYSVRENYRATAAGFDPAKFDNVTKTRPDTLYGMRMMERAFRSAETRMKQRTRKMEEATEAYMHAARDRAKNAEDMMRAEAAQKTARDWTEKNHGKGNQGD